MVPLNWIASPVLAQRNIELAMIDYEYDEVNVATIYKITDTAGRIGTFSIPKAELEKAVGSGNDAVKALLIPQFEIVEFTDGQSPVPELQPEPAAAEGSPGSPGTDEATVQQDGATEPSETAERSPSPETDPAGEGQEVGPGTEPTGEDSPVERSPDSLGSQSDSPERTELDGSDSVAVNESSP